MAIPISVFKDLIIDKHPGSTLDYVIDWEDWLAGDTITSSTWAVGTGMTKGTTTNTTTTTTVWLSGGTDGTIINVINTVVTTGGRTETKKFKFNITSKGGI
jgi:hypothetical protein